MASPELIAFETAIRAAQARDEQAVSLDIRDAEALLQALKDSEAEYEMLERWSDDAFNLLEEVESDCRHLGTLADKIVELRKRTD